MMGLCVITCTDVIILQKWTIHRGIRRKSGSPPRAGQPTDENTAQVVLTYQEFYVTFHFRFNISRFSAFIITSHYCSMPVILFFTHHTLHLNVLRIRKLYTVQKNGKEMVCLVMRPLFIFIFFFVWHHSINH